MQTKLNVDFGDSPDDFFAEAMDSMNGIRISCFSRSELDKTRDKLFNVPGLYILQGAEQNLYVGQSKSLSERLNTHRQNNKINFRKVFILTRDLEFAALLDYSEAKLHSMLFEHGFNLQQQELSNRLERYREREVKINGQKAVNHLDGLLLTFVKYCHVFGLNVDANLKAETCNGKDEQVLADAATALGLTCISTPEGSKTLQEPTDIFEQGSQESVSDKNKNIFPSYLEIWKALDEYIEKHKIDVKAWQPAAYNWRNFSMDPRFGHGAFVVSKKKRTASIELVFKGENGKEAFRALRAKHQTELDSSLDLNLVWDEMPTTLISKVLVHHELNFSEGLLDPKDLVKWLAETAGLFILKVKPMLTGIETSALLEFRIDDR